MRSLEADEMAFLRDEYEQGTKVEDIASVLSIGQGEVSRLAHAMGCKPRLNRLPGQAVNKKVSTEPHIEKKIVELERQQQLLGAQIRELKALKAIEFEYDNLKQRVTISGVDRFFIANGGLPKFREWLVKNFSVD